jgi:alkyl hydroperoxide reductase subunit F
MFDIIVIGAGPAGLAATAQAAQRQLRTLVIAPDQAGKAAYRLRLPWLQEHEFILGQETVEHLRSSMIAAPLVERRMDRVEHVFVHNGAFHVVSADGGAFVGRAVVVATGVTPCPLRVPGEERLMGYGVTYSATSHAPLFAERQVMVAGSDLRALHAVIELRAIAAHVTLVAPNRDALLSYTLARQLLEDPQLTVLAPAKVVEILGEQFVSGVIVATPDGAAQTIPVDGLFIENGLEAQTGFLGGLVNRSSSGHIIVDDRCASSYPGLFAAGDITSMAHAEQILIALGEGTKAGLSACMYVREGALKQHEVGV